MPCPVGALRKPAQPHLIATHPMAAPHCRTPHRTTQAAAGPWQERALEANITPTRAQRESPSFPEPPERAEDKIPRSQHPRRTLRRPGLQSDAAFLQNASAGCVAHPGFHPGLVCRVPLGHSGKPPNHTSLQHTPSQHPIAAPHRTTPSQHPIAAHPIAPPRRQRDLGRSAPWRRTPHPPARSAKAHPSQSLLSARRTKSRGARTRDAPFEGLAYRAMRRSFRTHRLGVSRTQGFTLGWYAVPRWGTPETRPTTPHCNTPHGSTPLPHTPSHHPGGSGILAGARLGGEHHTHPRAARKPILPRAS
jgi:hypothetical protein